MPLSYREVKDIYDSLPRNESIEQFSDRMNQLTGSSLYSSGLQDSWIKRSSVGIDRLLEATGLPDLTEQIGGEVGSWVGDEESGKMIGRSLPRGTINFLPALLPGAGIAGAIGTGLLSGADTYTQTGSAGAGVISGAISALMPGVSRIAERQVLKRLGVKPLEGTITNAAGGTQFIREFLPQNVAQGVGSYAGGELAASVFSEFGNMLTAATDPQQEYDFSPTRALLDMTLGQIPFAGLAAANKGVRTGFGGKSTREHEAALQKNITETNRRIQLKHIEEELKNQNPIERFPKVEQTTENLTILADTNRRLSELYQLQKDALKEPDSVSVDDAAARTDEIERLLQSARENNYDGSGVAGMKQSTTTTHQPMIGKEVFRNKRGTYRIVELEDGRRVGHSIISTTPQPRDVGRGEFKEYAIPNGYYTEVVNRPEFDPALKRAAKVKVVDPNQPELPTQADPLDLDEFFDSSKELMDAEKKLLETKTVVEYQAAVSHLNLVRGLNDMPELTDKQLERRRTLAKLPSLEKAALAELKKTQRLLRARNDAIAKHIAREEGVPDVAQSGATTGVEKTPLMQWGKEDSATQAAMDKVDEWLEESSVGATKEFETWNKTTTDKTTLSIERARLGVMIRLMQLGDVDYKAQLTEPELEAFSDALGEEGLRPANNEAVRDFLSRPHVNKMLQDIHGKFNPQPGMRAADVGWIPAGDGFVWGLSGYNPMIKKLGDRNVSELLSLGAFRNLAGKGQPLAEVELEMMKLVVPEAFVGDKVNVPVLYEGLKTKGPVIEVKKLDTGSERVGAERRVQAAIHELESRGYRVHMAANGFEVSHFIDAQGRQVDVETPGVPEDVAALMDNVISTGYDEQSNFGQAQYAFVAPKAEKEMPGYVEGLVRLPATADIKDVKYTGPHFGSDDTNVLAFFRGYEETLPDGRKAFHVIEVQSDWGQKQLAEETRHREELARLENAGVPLPVAIETKKQAQEIAKRKGHPLLKNYETLALKAAISHAKSIGAEALILSDAETAMMSEGHDRQVLRTELTDAERATWQPPQVEGMRLHYDRTLPSVAEKLTGGKGERVELGLHDKARVAPEQADMLERGLAAVRDANAKPPGSPVFRNSDGTPKSSITGRLYSLSNLPAMQSQGGFTLGQRNRAAQPYDPFIPTAKADIDLLEALQPQRGILGGIEYVAKTSTDPLYQGLAKDLIRLYPDVLQRNKLEFNKEVVGTRFEPDQTGNYRGRIILTDDFFAGNATFQEYALLHEALHAITATEIRNPDKRDVLGKLVALQSDLAESLPKDVKATFDAALESGFIRQYQLGLVPFDALHSDRETARLLYGLLDTDEFVAQGMTDSVVRDYMQGKKGTAKGKKWYTKFVDYLKALVGLPSARGTAFDDFLMHVEELTSDINSVVKYREFADSYLSRKGIVGEELNTKSRLSEGILTNIKHFDEHPDDLVTAMTRYEDHAGTSLARSKNILDNSIVREDEAYQGFATVMAEMGYDSTREGLDNFVKDVMTGDADWKTSFELMPSTASRYVFEKVNAINDVLDTIRAATDPRLKGFTNIKDQSRVRKHVNGMQKQIDKFLSAEKMLDEAVAALQGLMKVDPKGFFASMQTSESLLRAPAAEAFLNPSKVQEGWAKRTLGKLERFFKPISQYDDLEFREATSKGWQLPSNIRKMFSSSTEMFGYDLSVGELNHQTIQKAVKAISDPKISQAINNYIYVNNKVGKDTGAVTILPISHPEVVKALSGLTPEQKALVVDAVNKHSASNSVHAAQVLEKMSQLAVIDGARVLGVHNKGKVRDNVKFSEELWQTMHLDPSDPAILAVMQNKVAALQQRMTPEAFNDLFRLLQNQKAERDAQKETFDANPGWSSAQRFGKYRAKFFRNGKPIVIGANSKKDALAFAKGAPLMEFYERKTIDEDSAFFGAHNQKTIDRLNELKADNIALFNQLGFDKEFIDAYDRRSEATQFAREAAGETGSNLEGIPERGLTRGAEELPWLSNHFSWLAMSSAKWSRALFRHQMDAYLGQSEIAENPQMQSDLRQHRDNILQADPETIQNINSFTRTWFMGFNPANVIVNAAQPFTTHVAELTSLTNSVFGSYRRVKDALAEVAGRKWGNKEWASPEHAQLMQDAVRDGEVGLSQFDEDASIQEAAQVNFKRAVDHNRPKTLGQHIGSMFGAYSNIAMGLFRHGEMINNQAAILASFDVFRAQGMDYATAKQRAYDFNHTVNFGGGKANRPIGMFSGKGPVLRGAAMLASSMQSYVLGTTFQMIRHLKRGYFSGAKLTPAEKWGARKAGVQMLTTQFAAAGLLGLPFASAAIALLDKEFPELEVNKNLREWTQQLWAEDDENGHVMTDISMTGLPSMLGWDLQSRLSMGNTLPGVSEVNGFQPENLLGPPINLLSQFMKGGKKLVSGQGGPDAFLPSAIKKIANILQDDGKLRDYRDRPLPNAAITPGEGVGIALGFQPKRVSDFNAASRIAQQAESVEAKRKGLFRQELAEQVLEGNFGTVRQQLISAASADNTLDVVSEARSVAKAVEELTFPRDLRRDGSAPGRGKLLSAFSLDLTQPQEIARLQFRRQVEQRLGVPQSSSGGQEVFLAQLMDRLKLQFPQMTRRELRRLAEQQLRRDTTPSLVE